MAVGEHRSFDVIAERRERYSNLAEPESTSPIFMLKFLIIWSLLKGVKIIIQQSLLLFAKDSIPITNTVDLLLLDLLLVELIAV